MQPGYTMAIFSSVGRARILLHVLVRQAQRCWYLVIKSQLLYWCCWCCACGVTLPRTAPRPRTPAPGHDLRCGVRHPRPRVPRPRPPPSECRISTKVPLRSGHKSLSCIKKFGNCCSSGLKVFHGCDKLDYLTKMLNSLLHCCSL